MFGINASSAPGSDGMNGLFFQEYWDVVGEEISKEVKAFSRLVSSRLNGILRRYV